MKAPNRTEVGAVFVSDMLSWAPSIPDEDYKRICDVWLKATGADWVWLWLISADHVQNPIMQLVAVEPNQAGLLPDKLRNNNKESIAARALQTNSPIRVPDIESYVDDSGLSRVTFKDQLVRMGCKSFIAVPLRGLPASAEDEEGVLGEFKGVICLHYKDSDSITTLEDYDLKMMGAFTARTIVNSYYAHQRTILLSLERLQHSCLTSNGHKRPGANRADYLHRLIEIIRKHLRVKGVSIFYRDAATNEAVCIASTGVARVSAEDRKFSDLNPSPPAIPAGALSLLRYPPTSGRTGQCLETSRPYFLTDGLDPEDSPQSIELIDGRIQKNVPAIIYPIPAALSQKGDLIDGRALGVIRCKYHYSQYFENRPIFFSEIELETLHFIARQIAPALKILAEQIDRETVVSVTKHDLDTPIKMIWDKVANLRTEEAEEQQSEWIKVKRYDLLDIGFCGLLASKLVRQLDAFPGQIQEFNPEPTNLSAKIIAPVKNMLIHYAKEAKDMRIRFDGFEEGGDKKMRTFPDLVLDRMLISRVVINLLINAIKYGKGGTEITVFAHLAAGSYCIDVSNFGIGILPAEEKHVFTAGYRSPRARAVGTGLGLFIARRIMEKHGGQLSLVAGANPTVFRISFPDRLRFRR